MQAPETVAEATGETPGQAAGPIPDPITDPAPALILPLDPRRGRPQLLRWLRRLGRVFDLEALRHEAPDTAAVVQYYEQCHAAYRRFHSAEGAVHMALNPEGRFDAAGFSGQLRRLEARWSAEPPADVLELAFGQGYNLAWLLPRHAGVRFQGIDLDRKSVV